MAGGGVVAGAVTGDKRGGRAQVEGEPRRNARFTLSGSFTGATMSASCMADESAEQAYLEYDIEYCDGDDDDTMYVIPEEAELAQDETYVIRSVQECKATDNTLIAFGPAQHDC